MADDEFHNPDKQKNEDKNDYKKLGAAELRELNTHLASGSGLIH